MNKMDGKSMDLTAENIAQLKKVFPEAVTEGKVDFEVLKALLGGEVETRQEYYKFTWNGKEAARTYAYTPSKGALRPCVEESSGKDGTPGKFDSDNLYIEGDNLEVLKLLQGPYHKKVKMIYIDPPYNTGKDFVYPDNFKDSIGNYKALTGQTDDEGKSTRANPETSGRYHTDWLNMMYPRLILARNLLTDDGVIFISIDDTEVSNLRKLCEDVLGEENSIATFIWKKKQGGGNDSNNVVVEHEHVICWAKSIENLVMGLDKNYQLDDNLYPFHDEKGDYGLITLDKASIQFSQSLVFEIKGPDGKIYTPRIVKGKQSCWRWSKSKVENEYNDLVFKNDKVYTKYYRPEGITPKSLLIDSIYGRTESGNDDIKALFEQNPFSYPKPVLLLKHFVSIGAIKQNDVILDFFSGSATTAHAVMQLNAEDGGNRKYIMVQLPEPCVEGTEAAKAGYKNICEIGKERIRRAGNKLREEKPLDCQGKDMGFKVFKLDTSNLREWNPNSDTLAQDLLDTVNNILAGRTTEDLLYEVLLKCNLPLTLPIEERKVECVIANEKTQTNTIYVVGMGALAICLDENIPQTIAEEIVKLRNEYAPVVPMQVVFRDNGFDDVSKTNALQILKQAGFEEKSIQTF